jgi:hypothetical protein
MRVLTGEMNLRYNVSMENENEIIMKKWFHAEPLIKQFLKEDTKEGRCAFMNRLDIDHSRFISLRKPGQMISAAYADKYAIKLGYHPCQIWDDWFDAEPEGGSNPKMPKKKVRQPSTVSSHIVYTDTQPL